MPFRDFLRKGVFIMEEKDLQFIQNQIGYNFKNTDLLQQAFVRRSYSSENGGADNEVLEFIGDKALDIIVVKLLTEKFGYMASECDDYDIENEYDEFYCEHSEGELTEIKKHLVERKMLAHRIDVLGLGDYFIMGRGDISSQVEKKESVKEDLFEAVIGAVTLDSEWNFAEIESTVEVMLDIESCMAENKNSNYVELIQEWTLRNNNSVPLYYFEKGNYRSTWYYHFNGISQRFNDLGNPGHEEIKYHCLLNLSDELPIFRGFGSSKSEARKAVCELAYDYLDKNGLLYSIQDEIENPSRYYAVNQLETLARRGYFSIPEYVFEQKYDKDGNPVWKCECHIKEYDKYYQAQASAKKEAKKSAAFKMLKFVLR